MGVGGGCDGGGRERCDSGGVGGMMVRSVGFVRVCCRAVDLELLQHRRRIEGDSTLQGEVGGRHCILIQGLCTLLQSSDHSTSPKWEVDQITPPHPSRLFSILAWGLSSGASEDPQGTTTELIGWRWEDG